MSIDGNISDFSDTIKRYHLGCGPVIIKGFVNIDSDLHRIAGEIEEGVPRAINDVPNTLVMRHDLRRGIPSENKSLDIIYHSHFLEHLSREEAPLFLRECHRVLRKGGLMRIAVPDFELWCRNYVAGNREFFRWYRATYLGENNPKYKTISSIFTGMLYNWGHKMAYDYETLALAISEAGFRNVRRVTWGASDRFGGIAEIENDSPRRFESLLIECEGT
jgi:predicted SAM-dependent methyltransferase